MLIVVNHWAVELLSLFLYFSIIDFLQSAFVFLNVHVLKKNFLTLKITNERKM